MVCNNREQKNIITGYKNLPHRAALNFVFRVQVGVVFELLLIIILNPLEHALFAKAQGDLLTVFN